MAQTGERGAQARMPAWVRNLGDSLGRPVLAVVLAIIAGAVVILITWPNKTLDPFSNVLSAYGSLFSGSFGTPVSISNTLVRVSPLIFATLSVAIAFRAGLFNIGAAGQMTAGAMAADIIGLTYIHWPGWLLVPVMVIASILAGALWGGIVGFLKAWRGAHEVVTTIMLNWIAFWATDYIIDGPPFTAPLGVNQTNPLPTQATIPSVATLWNNTLGSFLPKLDTFSYTADVSIFIAIICIVIYWFITSRTTFGYEVRVIGQNPKAAKYAGIPIKRNILLVMVIAGAFSGLGGALHLMGQFSYQMTATAAAADPTGFDAIAAALLGRTTPVGILLSSLLFGGLRSGSTNMQALAHVDPNLVLILEGLIIYFMAADFIPIFRRLLPPWLRPRRKPSLLVPPDAPIASTVNGDNSEQGHYSAIGERRKEI
ncbi:MAG TPA: ABC transporter permease [Ktedonobacteraceae bacterium]|nr:ABC transporter permease [Ktedonobacteraceae bacterium]